MLGPEICKRYKKGLGYEIEFQRAESVLAVEGIKFMKVHYIMMLDDSGSMLG